MSEQGSTKNFFTPDEWYSHIANCKEEGNKYKVIRLVDILQDFHKLADDHFRWTSRKDIKMKQIRNAKFGPTDSERLSIKHSFPVDWKEIHVGKTDPKTRGRPFKVTSYRLQPPYDGPLPLKPKKLRNLAELCTKLIIPPRSHRYYTKLIGFPALDIALLEDSSDSDQSEVEYEEDDSSEEEDAN